MLSKVAMSVCALIVAGVMTDMVGTLRTDAGDDLQRLLSDLQGTVSRMAGHGGDVTLDWEVPFLPSGPAVDITIDEGVVTARSEGMCRSAAVHPELHSWTWAGGPLNGTVIEEMDLESGRFHVSSGDVLTLVASMVLLEDCPAVLMSVR